MTVEQQQVQWAQQLLRPPYLDVPLSTNAMTSLTAWEIAEGGWFANGALYNPLNTTWQMPGSTGVVDTGNGIYVQAYISETQGLQATYNTLRNYPSILACLQLGSEPQVTINCIAASSWGTLYESLEGALPAAEQAVATYWRQVQQEDPVFIKEADGTVYWFVAAGEQSYWRKVPPNANTANLSIVNDDGTWLNLWRVA